MPRIRALIVDDSVVVRRMLSEALSLDPSVEIAGTAANGRIALAKLSQTGADIVILDVEMPELGGLETLAAIRRSHPGLPVILYSALTERGAAVTLEALSMGASDYVTKPSGEKQSGPIEHRIAAELLPRIKALGGAARSTEGASFPPPRPASRAPERAIRPAVARKAEVVVIAASTGGPAVLCELLPALPATFPVPILIVQHMPPIFTRLFSERLAGLSRLRVVEGGPAESIQAGTACIAPGDLHLVVERRSGAGVRIGTNRDAPRSSCRPSADVLFESAAAAFGPATLGIVLTGMGQDGLEGSARIREAGGRVIVQDEESSVVWGMPGAVARSGLASDVVPRCRLAQEILRRVAAP